VVAEDLERQVHLLVALGVHEVEQVALAVEVLHLVLDQRRAVQIVFRAELVVDEPAGADVPHLGQHVPAFVARRDVVDLENAAETALVIDEHPLAEAGGLN
jgi:hypothetical protein